LENIQNTMLLAGITGEWGIEVEAPIQGFYLGFPVGFLTSGLLAEKGWPVIRRSEVARVGCLEGADHAARITGL